MDFHRLIHKKYHTNGDVFQKSGVCRFGWNPIGFKLACTIPKSHSVLVSFPQMWYFKHSYSFWESWKKLKGFSGIKVENVNGTVKQREWFSCFSALWCDFTWKLIEQERGRCYWSCLTPWERESNKTGVKISHAFIRNNGGIYWLITAFHCPTVFFLFVRGKYNWTALLDVVHSMYTVYWKRNQGRLDPVSPTCWQWWPVKGIKINLEMSL